MTGRPCSPRARAAAFAAAAWAGVMTGPAPGAPIGTPPVRGFAPGAAALLPSVVGNEGCGTGCMEVLMPFPAGCDGPPKLACMRAPELARLVSGRFGITGGVAVPIAVPVAYLATLSV